MSEPRSYQAHAGRHTQDSPYLDLIALYGSQTVADACRALAERLLTDNPGRSDIFAELWQVFQRFEIAAFSEAPPITDDYLPARGAVQQEIFDLEDHAKELRSIFEQANAEYKRSTIAGGGIAGWAVENTLFDELGDKIRLSGQYSPQCPELPGDANFNKFLEDGLLKRLDSDIELFEFRFKAPNMGFADAGVLAIPEGRRMAYYERLEHLRKARADDSNLLKARSAYFAAYSLYAKDLVKFREACLDYRDELLPLLSKYLPTEGKGISNIGSLAIQVFDELKAELDR